MKNILEITDLLSVDDSLSLASKNYPVIISLFFFGLASIFGAYELKDIDSAFYFLSLLGITLLILGVIYVFSSSRSVRSTHCNQKLKKHSFYFDSKSEKDVLQSIYNGDIDDLKKKDQTTGQVMAVVYTSSKHDYFIAQMFKFVPHEFQPCIDPIIYKK